MNAEFTAGAVHFVTPDTCEHVSTANAWLTAWLAAHVAALCCQQTQLTTTASVKGYTPTFIFLPFPILH